MTIKGREKLNILNTAVPEFPLTYVPDYLQSNQVKRSRH